MPRTVYSPHNRNGRPMKAGTIVSDGRGRMGVFLTYCDHCDSKVIFDRSELPSLLRRWDKQRRTMKIRVYRMLINHLNAHVNE